MQAPRVCGDTQDVQKASACYLLHPAGKTLSVGQPVVIGMPATLGAPDRLQLSQQHSAAGSEVLSSDLIAIPTVEGNEHRFVACWQAEWSELIGDKLQVFIGGQLQEVHSLHRHREEDDWTSCG